jgi:flavin reductase (DIM6/NTAB) family NADH-FMN oxidoreductase RutF
MHASPVTPDVFRQAMSHFASGVTVVTTIAGGEPHGLTVSAFCSISLQPPLVLVSLRRSSRTLPAIEQSRCFAVNLLTARQRLLATRFALADRQSALFHDVPHHRGTRLHEVALFDEALSRIECRVAGRYPGGDHVLLLGEVMAIESTAEGSDDEPLIAYGSAFRSLRAQAHIPDTP